MNEIELAMTDIRRVHEIVGEKRKMSTLASYSSDRCDHRSDCCKRRRLPTSARPAAAGWGRVTSLRTRSQGRFLIMSPPRRLYLVWPPEDLRWTERLAPAKVCTISQWPSWTQLLRGPWRKSSPRSRPSSATPRWCGAATRNSWLSFSKDMCNIGTFLDAALQVYNRWSGLLNQGWMKPALFLLSDRCLPGNLDTTASGSSSRTSERMAVSPVFSMRYICQV
jgi:hypothetical protein